MPAVELHPSRQELESFGLGRLADDSHAAVERHLDACSACQRVVDSVPGDALVSLLRSTASVSDTIKALEGSETVSDLPAAVAPAAGSRTGAWEAGETNADPPTVLVGHPKYEPTRRLGSGGMGTVWLARHRVMGRQVAVKVIRPEFVAKPGAAERFHREAQAAARLSHPNIVAAFDAEPAGDTHLLAMEYVDGVNLADLVKERGPLPVAEACDAVRQAALGLQHAFDCGLIHRDLKPHNLMRTADGTVKVLDFGLAVLADANRSEGGLTAENVVLGTPDYIAPEQAEDSRAADVRSDIYSLGCTLYHLLTGRVPFPGESVLRKLDGHRKHEPEPVRTIRPEVPAELAVVVARMMAKKPADRIQTPAEVAAVLAPFAAGTMPIRKRRRPWVAVAAALLVAIGLAAGVVYRIQTDNGELVITIDNEDVDVVIKQNGKQVRIIDTKTNKEVKLDSGLYELELKGNPEGLKLSLDKVTISRGVTVVATVERRSMARKESEIDVPRTPAPKDAVILFDGKSLDNWEKRGGGKATWELLADGVLEVNGGDIITKKQFGGNFKLHVEFRVPSMPWANGQGRGNSGVFVQGRYEVQILDSYRLRSGDRDCGAIYGLVAPSVNTCKAPGVWQSYDIEFTAPVCKDGKKVELGRMTVFQNGVRIHDNVKLTKDDTGQGMGGDPCTPGPILLQGHGSPVQFRNIWLVRPADKVGEVRRFAWGGGQVMSVAISPDGRWAVSGDEHWTVRFWDLRSGQEVPGRRLPDHRHQVQALAFSPDGTKILSGGKDSVLRLSDAATGREIRCFAGHKDGVLRAAFSPDGKHILAGDWKGGLRVWDVESGIDLLKLEGHTDVVTGVAFSRDGKTAASGSGRDNTIRLWDLKTGKEVRRIDNANGVNEMAFSPDGRRLLSCHEDGTLRWWDVATGKELRRFPVQTDTLQAVALSADGRLAITGGGFDITGGGWKYGTDFALRLWDVAEGKELYCFKGHENPIIDLALSRDGRYALSGSVDGTMRQWRLPDAPPPEKAAAPKSDRELIVGTWKVVAEEVAGQPLPQEILDALKLTLTFTADNVIGRPEGQFPKPLVEALIAKGVLPKEAAVALEKGVEGIYHLDPTKTPKTFDLTYLSPIRKTALGIYALDGDTLKLCLSINPEQVADRPTEFATKGGGLRILVTLKRQPPEKVGQVHVFEGHKDIVHGIAISRDGRYAVSGAGMKHREGKWVDGAKDYDIRLYDLATRTELRRLPGSGAAVWSVAMSPDGSQVLSGGGNPDGAIRLLDAATGNELKRSEARKSAVWSLAFSPDGHYALDAADYDNDFRLRDVASGQEVRRFVGHTKPVRRAIFSPDSRHVLSCSWDGTARLWDLETGNELKRFAGHVGYVAGLAMSPDGRRVLTGGNDHTLRLWDVETGKELKCLNGHKALVTSVAFSPDGRFALSASGDTWAAQEEDYTLRLWDLESGKEVHRFEGHTDVVEQVLWLPDGVHALSCSWDTTVRLWRLPDLPNR